MTNNDGLERQNFENWLAGFVGIEPSLLAAIRQDDPQVPYFHEDYDEEALKLIIISWNAWLARSKQEQSNGETNLPAT